MCVCVCVLCMCVCVCVYCVCVCVCVYCVCVCVCIRVCWEGLENNIVVIHSLALGEVKEMLHITSAKSSVLSQQFSIP